MKIRKLAERRRIMFLRAATVLVERVLRHDTSRAWSISDLADQGMIRKRWVREACIESPNIKAVPVKGKTRFQYEGIVPYRNPQAPGPDPQKTKKAAKKMKLKGKAKCKR